jgi:hypothetical protein
VHRNFADWYRAASLEPKADELQKRWQGIDAFAKGSSGADLPKLARLFYGLAPRDATFEERFRAPFKAADDAFAMEGNAAELRVLAGATLVRHFDFGGGWAAGAALGLAVPACVGLRLPPVGGMVELAAAELSRRSALLRRGTGRPLPRLDVGQALQTVKTALQGNQVPNAAEPLTGVLQQFAKAVGQLAEWAEQAEEEQRLRKEESDVLWWLAGAHSRDLGLPLSDLKSPSGCLVVAKELADLTGALPGPYAAEAFLDNALRLAHPDLKAPVSVADAVAACPPEWRAALAASDGLEEVLDLCPAHTAVRKCVESDGKKTWQTAFQAAAGFKATVKLKPLDLALQTYRERLLARAVRELKEEADG